MDKSLKKVGRGVKNVTKTASNVTKAATSTVRNVKKHVVEGVLVLLLAVYSGVVVNFCPLNYLEFFENIIVKIIFLIVIAFVGLYSPSIALFLAIALIVTLQMAQKKKISRDLDVLNTGNINPKDRNVEGLTPESLDEVDRANMVSREQAQEQAFVTDEAQDPVESFSNMNTPAGYNNDASCVQSCEGVDTVSDNLSGQCSVVKTWDNQISAQGLQCPPGPTESVGAPF
jgi:hypothetical protein